MSGIKTAKDVMVDVFAFPHIPYWFSLRQAIGIVQKSLLSSELCHHPLALLVFDEKYNLLGTLGLKDVLKGLEPSFLQTTTKAQVPEEETGAGLSLIWESIFSAGSHEKAENPVGEAMVPAKYFVQPEEPITKAAYLMIRHNLALLPVLEEKKKLVGLVRDIEIFSELSSSILKG